MNTIMLLLLFGLPAAPSSPADSGRALHAANSVDYAWLAGTWTGDGLGGISEEIWSEPSADGTMFGMYRHSKEDGSVNFYELIVLDADGMRLKHFTPRLVGWEPKEEHVSFDMVRLTPGKIEMESMTYELIAPDSLEVRLELHRDGKVSTEVFRMKRRGAGSP